MSDKFIFGLRATAFGILSGTLVFMLHEVGLVLCLLLCVLKNLSDRYWG